ncbi:MAG: translation initiation factor IF-3 [Candidatus Omnitrophota bacterium]|nr:translation initiation factor IF-3 [Candidatus Omnitrophota bacterium]
MIAIQKQIRVNERIRAAELRVIGPQGEQLGVISLKRALELTNQYELDLVEVAPTATPPVCRIMNFSKYKYEQEQREREVKKHQKQGHLKEIRVKPNIEEHDYQVKLRQLITFLKKKDKVKINLIFRGRELAHQDIGRRVLDKFINDMQEFGALEKGPVMEGRVISLMVAPK